VYQFEIFAAACIVLSSSLAGGMFIEQLEALARIHWAKAQIKLFYHQPLL